MNEDLRKGLLELKVNLSTLREAWLRVEQAFSASDDALALKRLFKWMIKFQ